MMNLKPRDLQLAIGAFASFLISQRSIIVAPCGKGKSWMMTIAAMINLNRYANCHCVLVFHNKLIMEEHYRMFQQIWEAT